MDDFLRQRGLSDAIERFKANKIDEHIVSLMSDEQLIDYGINNFGDRIALRAYVTSQESSTASTSGTTTPGHELLERIKHKLECKMKKGTNSKQEKLIGNANATRPKRRVEIGWLMKEEDGQVKQIRAKTGGGTRSVTLESSDTVGQVKEAALKFFFPSDKSSQNGPVEDFHCIMSNFDTTELDLNVTIQDLYANSSLKMLRLYLHTTRKNQSQEKPAKKVKLVKMKLRSASVAAVASKCDDNDAECLPDLDKDSNGNYWQGVCDQFVLDSEDSHEPQPFPDLMLFNMHSDQQPVDTSNLETTSTILDTPERHYDNADGVVQFLLEQPQEENAGQGVASNDLVRKIKLHRGRVMEELENYFMENDFDINVQTLHITMVLPNGSHELAEDNGGVLRDALSEYWESFYQQRTVGDKLKVPSLSHTCDGKRWEAISKIISIGYVAEGYFPTQIASCFFEYCFEGDTVPMDMLLEQFIQFLPESERTVARQCLDDYDKVEQDELLDFLGDHGVRVLPTKENITKILTETAHKELIQCPTFVADCWKNELITLRPHMKKTFREFNSMVPTFKEVWQSLQFDDGGVNREVIGYLKRFLKEQTTEQLKNFLRFCTGAEMFLGKEITVRLVPAESDFLRRPIAHACGCVLEVPSSYQSFVELRNDFAATLKSSVWLMDIV